MKQLVLLAEGHGETSALPILVRKVLLEREPDKRPPLDKNVIRFGASRVFRWDKTANRPDYGEWLKAIRLAGRRSKGGGVLAVYDGDLSSFPPGSGAAFCAFTAATSLAAAAVEGGAGKTFSLAVVFACVEYETWLVAGAESLIGRRLKDGRLGLPTNTTLPLGDPESHGKRWLEKNCPNYLTARDQSALTELLDLECVRAKGLRSFRRFEHAVDLLLEAIASGSHICNPS
jgi:hypothetical protein